MIRRALACVGRYRSFLIGLALLVGYWPVAAHVPSDPQFEGEHAMRLAFGATAILLYLPLCWRALSVPVPSYSGQLTLGIGMSLVGGVGSSTWLIVWRLGGKPDWMLNANIVGWWVWWQILGIVLHVTAKRVVVGGVERTNWRWIGIAVALGFGLTAVVVGIRPDLRWLTVALGRYLDDGF